MTDKIKSIKNLYILVLIILFFLIIFTPSLIKDGFSLLTEEIVETIMLSFLMIASLIIYSLYQQELARSKKKFDEAAQHLGIINVQIENLKTIFHDIKKYPESRSDWKYILKSFSDKVLGIVDSDWVMFRIIETNTGRSLTEHLQTRANRKTPNNKIGNKALMEKNLPGTMILASNQENFNIKAFCVIPAESVSDHQKILVDSIVNNLAMFYIIFTSKHYRIL